MKISLLSIYSNIHFLILYSMHSKSKSSSCQRRLYVSFTLMLIRRDFDVIGFLGYMFKLLGLFSVISSLALFKVSYSSCFKRINFPHIIFFLLKIKLVNKYRMFRS